MAELVTRVISQQPNRIQTVIFVIKVPVAVIIVIVISRFLFFIYPFFLSSLLVPFITRFTLFWRQSSHACSRTPYSSQFVSRLLSNKRPNLFRALIISDRSIVWHILSQNLVCRFVLCCPDISRMKVSGPFHFQ